MIEYERIIGLLKKKFPSGYKIEPYYEIRLVDSVSPDETLCLGANEYFFGTMEVTRYSGVAVGYVTMYITEGGLEMTMVSSSMYGELKDVLLDKMRLVSSVTAGSVRICFKGYKITTF